MNMIQTKPEPYCPICGAKMVLRRPKPNQSFDPFWGCSQYPDCHGSRNINKATGKPDDDNKFGYDDPCNDLYGDK
jgi:ssDNA-binding Zn-finger/Zn-ribbon topoisomerase 1